jgi:hypothetical protein
MPMEEQEFHMATHLATATRLSDRKVKRSPARTPVKKRRASKKSSGASAGTAQTKTTDSKGRVLLGGHFANRAVLVEQLSDTEVLVKMARVIPEREAWLYENPAALAAVRKGLAQARAGQVGSGPDLDADQALIDQIKE